MAFATIILPNYASAFWPFSTNVDAAVNPFIPDSRTPALVAATNFDPNPNKGLGDTITTSGGKALLSFAGPSGTIVNVASAIPSDRISVYVVRPGDTLSDIAAMFNVSVNTIIWANDLKSARDVHPGDTLIILPISGIEHTIVKNDTLKSIAKKYGGDASEIAQYNGLDVTVTLVVGSTVIIPGGEIALPAAAPRSQSSPIPSPLIVGGGTFQAGYYSNPVPGALVTQGIHGRNGIDLGAPRGTPVHAAADGVGKNAYGARVFIFSARFHC